MMKVAAPFLSAVLVLSLASPVEAGDPGPGCDPVRPALAHHAGGEALPIQPSDAPIPCVSEVGPAIEGATIGVTSSGAVFFASIEQIPLPSRVIVEPSVVARSTDLGASWDFIIPGDLPTSPHGSLSTWLRVDPETDRVWYATPTAPCGATVSWSDDDGETWETFPNVGCPAQGASALIEGPVPPGGEPLTGDYPHVVYYCANAAEQPLRDSSVLMCYRSLNGGHTWSWIGSTPDPIPAPEGCDATHFRATRAGEVGTDGVLYFPTYSCDDTLLGMAVSDDEGATWTRHEVLTTEIQDLYPPALGIDEENNLFLAWKGPGGLPYLAVSTNQAQDWSEPMMIAPPEVNVIRRLAIVARDEGHIVVSYLGSTDGGESFHAYITESRNALGGSPVFWSAPINDPEIPVLLATSSETFANRIQLLRGHIADDGTPWAAFHCYDTDLCPGLRTGLAGRLQRPE